MTNGHTRLAKIEKELRNIIRAALGRTPDAEFSDNAFNKLQNLIKDYVHNLVTESIIVSKRHGTDCVSESHVDIANAYLIAHTKNKLYALIESIGGIILGVGLSGLYLIITSTSEDPTPTSGIIFTFFCGIIGILFIAVGYRH